MHRLVHDPDDGPRTTLWVESSVEPLRRAQGNPNIVIPVYARTSRDGDIEPHIVRGASIISIDSVNDPHRPVYAANLALFSIAPVSRVLLIRRRDDADAFPGAWALPGGHVNADETAHEAACRDLAEETGVSPEALGKLKLVGVYDDTHRDPRGRVVSVAYTASVENGVPPEPTAGSDAAEAAWMPIFRVLDGAMPVAFDHLRIITDAYTVCE